MTGEERRDCETRRSQSTDAQNMCDVHSWIFLWWKGKQLSQVFANKETEDILFFFHLPTLYYYYYFFQLVALAGCHEMGFYNNEWMNVKNGAYFHREISLNSLWLLELALCSASFIVSLFLQ